MNYETPGFTSTSSTTLMVEDVSANNFHRRSTSNDSNHRLTNNTSRAKPSMLHRFQTHWILNRSNILFTAFVTALQITLGGWYLYHVGSDALARRALGWGAIIAKAAAGALYPTMLFLLLSMSRWTITLLRSSAFLARAIQFDNMRTFHVQMAIEAFILAWIHTLGHLCGTYVHASRPSHNTLVVKLLGPDFRHAKYIDFIRTLPAWTGILAIFCFSVIAVGATPRAKKLRYEIFQYSHYFLYPYLILLSFHGAARELAFPVMPFVIAIPTILIVLERSCRLLTGFRARAVYIKDADHDVMHLTIVETMMSRFWPYRVGQYVLIRVPKISRWEWHPFTIGQRRNGTMELSVKKAGKWTQSLAEIARESDRPITLNIDGPYGAPAQSFYHFDHCIVIATGIGVTPCSAILSNMSSDSQHLWTQEGQRSCEENPLCLENGLRGSMPHFVDFSWSVPNQDLLPWFADIFASTVNAEHNRNIEIGLRISVTRAKQEELLHEKLHESFSGRLGVHIEAGRPDYRQMFAEHYEKMESMQRMYQVSKRRQRIGVFFCGTRVVRDELAKLCYDNTLRSVAERAGFEYHFHPEVF